MEVCDPFEGKTEHGLPRVCERHFPQVPELNMIHKIGKFSL